MEGAVWEGGRELIRNAAGAAGIAEATSVESVRRCRCRSAERASERPHCILPEVNSTQLFGVSAEEATAISQCILHVFILSLLFLFTRASAAISTEDDTSSWACCVLTRIGMHMHAPAGASNQQHRPFIN